MRFTRYLKLTISRVRSIEVRLKSLSDGMAPEIILKVIGERRSAVLLRNSSLSRLEETWVSPPKSVNKFCLFNVQLRLRKDVLFDFNRGSLHSSTYQPTPLTIVTRIHRTVLDGGHVFPHQWVRFLISVTTAGISPGDTWSKFGSN